MPLLGASKFVAYESGAERSAPRRKLVETRLIVAYSLILLMVLAAIALGFAFHRNSHAQKAARDRRKDEKRREDRPLK